MNAEKLKHLQESVRIGGKGTARRKKKVIPKNTAADDKKIQLAVKKIGVSVINGIEEVNLFKDNGEVICFNNPKVQACLQSNTFVVTGHAETKQITDMLPSLLSQLRGESLASTLGGLSSFGAGTKDENKKAEIDEDDEVPDLVENFDEPSKTEVA